MPINTTKLQKVLAQMRKERLSKGVKSSQTHSYIDMLHNYCVEELERAGFVKDKPNIQIMMKKSIPRIDKPKELDVCILHQKAGPLLGISIKSLNSSITNNFTNTYEMMIGDATLFHKRYPLMVFGHLFLIPKDVSVFKGSPESYDLDYYSKLLHQHTTGRKDPSGEVGKFERVALLVVDFKKKLPEIVRQVPSQNDIRIETFFEDLVKLYRERNYTLKLD